MIKYENFRVYLFVEGRQPRVMFPVSRVPFLAKNSLGKILLFLTFRTITANKRFQEKYFYLERS